MPSRIGTVKVRRKVVDGTPSRMQVPATTPPRYAVASGVRCVPVTAMALTVPARLVRS